jgi:ubiquinone/menaquinone biosynthesis C-methylase UbiE
LEIGFGTGHTLASLAKAVGPKGKVFGIDLSDRMVKLAKERLAKAGLLDRAKIRYGDATRLPCAASSMDGVFMSFTLELFDTPEIPKVLGDCQRVPRPGGRIVVVGMSNEGPKDPLVKVFEWTHEHISQFLDCRPIYVRRALEEAGFTIRKAATKRMWIPVEIVLGIKKVVTGQAFGLAARTQSADPTARPEETESGRVHLPARADAGASGEESGHRYRQAGLAPVSRQHELDLHNHFS